MRPRPGDSGSRNAVELVARTAARAGARGAAVPVRAESPARTLRVTGAPARDPRRHARARGRSDGVAVARGARPGLGRRGGRLAVFAVVRAAGAAAAGAGALAVGVDAPAV